MSARSNTRVLRIAPEPPLTVLTLPIAIRGLSTVGMLAVPTRARVVTVRSLYTTVTSGLSTPYASIFSCGHRGEGHVYCTAPCCHTAGRGCRSGPQEACLRKCARSRTCIRSIHVLPPPLSPWPMSFSASRARSSLVRAFFFCIQAFGARGAHSLNLHTETRAFHTAGWLETDKGTVYGARAGSAAAAEGEQAAELPVKGRKTPGRHVRTPKVHPSGQQHATAIACATTAAYMA